MTHEIVSNEICLWYAHERKPIKHGCPGPPKMMFGSWQFAFRNEDRISPKAMSNINFCDSRLFLNCEMHIALQISIIP